MPAVRLLFFERAGIVFALAGGDASTLGGASTEPVYLPDSDFVLVLVLALALIDGTLAIDASGTALATVRLPAHTLTATGGELGVTDDGEVTLTLIAGGVPATLDAVLTTDGSSGYGLLTSHWVNGDATGADVAVVVLTRTSLPTGVPCRIPS